MKCLILTVGKEKDTPFDEALSLFQGRLLRYLPLEVMYIEHSSKEKEGKVLVEKIKTDDYVVLLDERGSQLTSEGFADLVSNRMVDSVRRIVFIIGGAYGVSPEIFKRANYMWKLSSLVFPHMLVRVMLLEQLYRAMTIIHGEKYHHR